ncbi:MAG: substrate-binding domain-containing protein, partial [Chloroflexota bacterium]
PFWTTFARGVEDVCWAHDLHVILCNTDEKDTKLANYVQMLLQRQTDGFLLVPTGKHSDAVVDQILQTYIPLVVVDRPIRGVRVDTVRSESEKGAYLLTNHLLSLGHRRIGILTGPPDIYTSKKRVEGYRLALQEAGIPVDEGMILYGTFTAEGGYAMTETILADEHNRPTAIIAAQNFIAIGVVRALRAAKLNVPDDLSIVSIDDLPFYTDANPFLTVVSQNPYAMGCGAAKLLISRIENPQKEIQEIILPMEFRERRSTARLQSNTT